MWDDESLHTFHCGLFRLLIASIHLTSHLYKCHHFSLLKPQGKGSLTVCANERGNQQSWVNTLGLGVKTFISFHSNASTFKRERGGCAAELPEAGMRHWNAQHTIKNKTLGGIYVSAISPVYITPAARQLITLTCTGVKLLFLQLLHPQRAKSSCHLLPSPSAAWRPSQRRPPAPFWAARSPASTHHSEVSYFRRLRWCFCEPLETVETPTCRGGDMSD